MIELAIRGRVRSCARLRAHALKRRELLARSAQPRSYLGSAAVLVAALAQTTFGEIQRSRDARNTLTASGVLRRGRAIAR